MRHRQDVQTKMSGACDAGMMERSTRHRVRCADAFHDGVLYQNRVYSREHWSSLMRTNSCIAGFHVRAAAETQDHECLSLGQLTMAQCGWLVLLVSVAAAVASCVWLPGQLCTSVAVDVVVGIAQGSILGGDCAGGPCDALVIGAPLNELPRLHTHTEGLQCQY